MWFFVSFVENKEIKRVLFRAETKQAAIKIANVLGGVAVLVGGVS